MADANSSGISTIGTKNKAAPCRLELQELLTLVYWIVERVQFSGGLYYSFFT
jgi:hypothetical protein